MSFVHRITELVEGQGSALVGKADHWERVPLRQVAKVINGYPFASSGFNTQAGKPVVRIRDVTSGETSTLFRGDVSEAPKVEHGDLVIGMDGDFNSRLWPGDTAWLNQRVCKVEPLDRYYSKGFLAYTIPAYLKLVNDNTSAITVKHLSSATVQELPLPLPPRAEQDRVASKIDELFSRIDEGERALKRVEKLVERYRQSVLKAAVTGELTRDWRAARKRAGEPAESGAALLARILKARRAAWEAAELAKLKAKGKPPIDDHWKQKYKEPEPPNTTDLPELPEGWVWTSIGEMKSFSLYGPRFSSEDYAVDGYSILRTSDISASGRVNLATTPKLHLSREEYEKYKVEQGDLLVTRTGSLGTLALYDDDVEANPGAYLIQFRIPAPSTTRWYLFHFLRSPTGQRNLLEGGAGVGRPNLNAPHIESIPVPLPPLEEQSEIIQRIDEVTVLCEKRYADCLHASRSSAALRQSILKAAFSGQLVPQDPKDEPASKLLERIAAERAAAPTLGQRKKKSA
jgi:type I restriction enzyme S subunit